MSKGSASESSAAALAKHARTSNRDVKKGKSGQRKDRDEAAALQALHAHFAGSFDVERPIKPAKKRVNDGAAPISKNKAKDSRDGAAGRTSSENGSSSNTGTSSSALPGSAERSRLPKGAPTKPSPRRAPQTIVFGQSGADSATGESSRGWRKFMSSKIEKAGVDEDRAGPKTKRQGRADDDGDDAEDATDEIKNLTNDRALSELLSTTLFAPGAQDTRRANGKQNLGSNETMARLLELSKPTLTSHAASLGRGLGAAALKAQDMGRMPRQMRHGMREAEQARLDKDVAKQKELGNYHSSIKGLMGHGRREGMDLILGETDKNRQKRTRQRGLGPGMGSFQNGTLRISDRDVSRINDSGRAGSGGNKRRRK